MQRSRSTVRTSNLIVAETKLEEDRGKGSRHRRQQGYGEMQFFSVHVFDVGDWDSAMDVSHISSSTLKLGYLRANYLLAPKVQHNLRFARRSSL